jgi:hypothetical protein
MSSDELKRCITTTPFRPFLLNIADGRRVPVTGRDFILVPPEKGRTVVVYQKDGGFDLLDTMLITGVSFDPIADTSMAG